MGSHRSQQVDLNLNTVSGYDRRTTKAACTMQLLTVLLTKTEHLFLNGPHTASLSIQLHTTVTTDTTKLTVKLASFARRPRDTATVKDQLHSTKTVVEVVSILQHCNNETSWHTAYGPRDGADLRFCSPQPDTRLHCETTEMGLVHIAWCSCLLPTPKPLGRYTAWWQRHIGVNNLPKVTTRHYSVRVEHATYWSRIWCLTEWPTFATKLIHGIHRCQQCYRH